MTYELKAVSRPGMRECCDSRSHVLLPLSITASYEQREREKEGGQEGQEGQEGKQEVLEEEGEEVGVHLRVSRRLC